MRLHQLTVTAFGPFAGTECVDFTDLNDAGLFLLTGPTGAGKTSILDAVCFALFGSVPGVRGVKTLKSHHAPDDVAPEVVLDFTVQDRRFVVRRTPEWQRPKKRGTGLLTEKASATLVEKTTGTDHFLSSRAQEVGHLVGELVGMTASQFAQVAMLPQGGFATFLRAGSDERHAVLQHLFRTDRFSRIEEWVNDHSRRLRAEAGDGQGAVQRILDTAADRAGVPVPEELSGDALPQAATDGKALPWLDGLLDDARAATAQSRSERDRTAADLAAARTALDAGRTVTQALERVRNAAGALSRLAEHADTEEEARRALDRHASAAPCLPLLELLDEAGSARDAAAARLATLTVPSGADPGSASEPAVDDLRVRASHLEQLLPREREHAEETAAQRRDTAALARLDDERQTLDERRVALPGELAAARCDGEQATGVAARHEAIELALTAARTRQQAAVAVPRAEADLVGLRDAERDARTRSLDARERVQDLQDRRLAGIAAELAGRLEDGRPCQVCGGTEHPAPARAGADAVTEQEQEEAGAAYDKRTDEFAAASRAVAEAERGLAVLVEAAGGRTPEVAAADVASLEAALEAAEAARVAVRAAATRVTALESEQHDLDARAAELATQAASLRQACTTRAEALARLAEEITAATGGAASVTAALTELRARLDLEVRRRDAHTALEAAQRRHDEVRTRAEAVASEHGFADLAAVRAAALPEDERRDHERLVADRVAARTRAQAVLDDPAVQGFADADLPDLPALTLALAEAEDAAAEAARTHHADDDRAVALSAHRVRLVDALTAWAPVRDEFVRADAMSKLVRGMGGDNHLQMRLSAYVLATRLDQVVDAANERLGHMRDQRYLLQRTGRAARKGSQAGLGLEVVDQWTGETRDPTTLSGGETFVVSLSLALGLADVVTQETGGTEIETLFVDEGFGTLDADTLDDVMDRLDGLRAGGRTVGVVSHVAEMRNRIPTQVHVDKQRGGSRIALRTLTA